MRQDDIATAAKRDFESWRRRGALLLVAMAACVVTGQAARAQDAPRFDTIRRTQVSATDRQVIQAWLHEQLAELFQVEDGKAAGFDLFFRSPNGLVPHFRSGDATEGFRAFLAEALSEAVLRAYENHREQAEPAAVSYAITALRIFGRPSALPSFQAALGDPLPAVRLLAARGIFAARDQIDGNQWPQVVSGVQQAAIAERHADVLRGLYQCLQVDAAARLPQALPAIQAVLEARLQRFEEQGELPADADADVVLWLARQFGGINNPQMQNQLITATGRLLANAVYAFMLLSPPPDSVVLNQVDPAEAVARSFPAFFGLEPGPTTVEIETGDDHEAAVRKLRAFYERVHDQIPATRDRIRTMERIIHDAESALGAMVRARVTAAQLPNIATPLLRGGRERARDVIAELHKWIGDEETEGLLNREPFQMPRGLGINRTLPEALDAGEG